MTSRVITLRPDDKVVDALLTMHRHHIRNLPVVDENGNFVGLFGVRRLGHLLLPKAARDLDRYNISDLSFLPDETEQLTERWRKIASQPVSEFLEKQNKLSFCAPDTSFPQLLGLLEQSKDSSLPVIIVQGKSRKLVGMVSSWDILEVFIMGLLADETTRKSAADDGLPDKNNPPPSTDSDA
ncbi:MAG: CBS domain-containing protein [Gammaproteobacteria bacterium]